MTNFAYVGKAALWTAAGIAAVIVILFGVMFPTTPTAVLAALGLAPIGAGVVAALLLLSFEHELEDEGESKHS